jgi:hypothetical protein
MSPASLSDIESRWRPLSDLEGINASTFLEDAWAMLLGRRPSLEADMIAGKVMEENVRRVLAAMVLRVLKNPEGYDSETIDDYTYRRNALVSAGLLHVTPDELADITPGRRRRSSVRLVIYGDA